MVVGQLLITPTVGICIQQLGRIEDMVKTLFDTEYLTCAELLRRAGLSAAAETHVISSGRKEQCICIQVVKVL